VGRGYENENEDENERVCSWGEGDSGGSTFVDHVDLTKCGSRRKSRRRGDWQNQCRPTRPGDLCLSDRSGLAVCR
jgi:hypothetical protein